MIKIFTKRIFFLFLVFIIINNFSMANTINQNFLFDAYYSPNDTIDISYADRAALNLKNKNYKKAKNFLNKSLKYDTNKDLYLAYAVKGSFELNNNLELAQKDFEKSLEYLKYNDLNNPPINSYLTYNGLAKLYLCKQDYDKALEYSDMAFNSPRLEKEYIETRITILKLGNIKGKTFKYAKELDFHGPFQDNVSDWQETLEKLDKCDKNIKDFSHFTFGEELAITKKQIKSAENKKEKLYKSYLNRAALYGVVGYKDLAWQDVEKVMKNYYVFSSEEKVEVNMMAAEIQEKLFNNYEKAIEFLTKAIEIDNKNHCAHQTRAMLYVMNTNKFSNAKEDIEFIMSDNPEELDYSLAIVYYLKVYDCEKALFYCNKAIEYYPKNEDFKDIKKAILKAKKQSENIEKQERIREENEHKKELKRQKWYEKRPKETWLYYFHRTGQNPFTYLNNLIDTIIYPQ